jgi:imidazolonepropionase-like amidohydrolase
MGMKGAACVALLAAVAAFPQPERKVSPRPIIVLGGTLIDGTGDPPRRNDAIVIADGRIKSMGLDAARHVPKDARQIDATDKWIVPGFVDGAVHVYQSGGIDSDPGLVRVPGAEAFGDAAERIRRNPAPYLRACICAGITTVNDLGGPAWTFDLRDSREADSLAPRMTASGPMLTTLVPAALQLAGGEPFWKATDAATAVELVARLKARQPALVSILWRPDPAASLEKEDEIVKAAVDAAHAARLRAAVQAETLDTARRAVLDGADVLVGGVRDEDVDASFVELLLRRHTVYLPTMIAHRRGSELAARHLALDSIDTRCAPEAVIDSLEKAGRLPADAFDASMARDTIGREQANLGRLAAAGVTIVAGSGAGNPGTPHGSSLHHELALMAGAGLPAMQVLLSATRHAAAMLGREKDLGEVKPGMLADLVLLDRDPVADITNTRRIATVIRGGTIYER